MQRHPVSKLSNANPTDMLLTYAFVVIVAAVVIGIVLLEHAR